MVVQIKLLFVHRYSSSSLFFKRSTIHALVAVPDEFESLGCLLPNRRSVCRIRLVLY